MSIVKCLSLSLLFLLLLMHSTTTAAEYTIPCAAWSVYAGDLDLDGDKDIVVGHKTGWGYDSPTITILKNEGHGYFTIFDTSFVFCGYQENIFAQNIDNDSYPDIVTLMSDFSSGTAERYIRICYNDNGYYNEFIDFSLNTSEKFSNIIYGDIDDDNDIDITVASNNGFFWGYLLNNGDGEFSLPTYYNLSFPPGGIACGDLNNDSKEDIVVCGYKLEVYLSYPDSFQCMLVDVTDYQNDVKIGDIDNDGDNDLVVARYGAPHLPHSLQIYHNDGNCNFTLAYEEAIPIGISDLQLTDLNNDSYLDIIYTKVHGQNYVCVRMNNGDGIFLYEENYNTNLGCIQCFSADLDGNGWNDIITTCVGNNISSVYILFNDTTGNFVEEPQVCINEENEILYNISNYPNPFHNTTTISFSVRGQDMRNPKVMIYNLKGQLVKEIENITKIDSCNYSAQWDGKNNKGREVANGVYLFTLRLGDISISKRILIVR